MSPYSQAGFRVRCEWGPAGAKAVGSGTTIVAVVDVLSFTTSLTVAADRGIEVFPFRWRDERAVAFAAGHRATLAVGRSQVGPDHPVSLSPATIRSASGIERLVLPSPNGSAIARILAEQGATVIGVSLRNARAAAAWTARHLRPTSGTGPGCPDLAATTAGITAPAGITVPNGIIPPAAITAPDGITAAGVINPPAGITVPDGSTAPGGITAVDGNAAVDGEITVAVIPAGERWLEDGSLRPAAEDLWGAGAFIAGLVDEGVCGLSPEAQATVAAYRQAATDIPTALHDCAGGRELTAFGFPEDVAIAAELNSSDVVPLLTGDSFRPAAARGPGKP
ncbi:2-phosphosulfolactate phosphatase [Actinoplanes sp. G11-F43]|uniref:2-phosphosulfolactate phosphatase n=1 Tax=Actinoplanes sp. G11-F43 TaxID=3424130 RepID=UPI003D3400BC